MPFDCAERRGRRTAPRISLRMARIGGGPGMFKHAPALAEHVADLLTGAALPQASFALPVRAPRLSA
jgi:hypothetical protein